MRNWIAVDWGTSSLRAWHMSPADVVLDQRRSDQGMGGLAPDAFEPALLTLVADWLEGRDTTDIVICGMAGARQGWQEAPYQAVPCAPVGPSVAVKTRDPRLNVHLLAGLCQNEPADVMRGEETQIAGYMAQNPTVSGVLCLPGTHSKWARITSGKVTGFTTAMTGEVFSLLSKQSVLRFNTADGWDDDAFARAVREGAQRADALLTTLFSLRAGGLLADVPVGASRARLSGLLIGAECASCLRPGDAPVIIGDEKLGALYHSAFNAMGISSALADGDGLTRAGLCAAHRVIASRTGVDSTGVDK